MRGASDGRGIIPAYAGSTTRREVIRHGIWDHPRVCGEHGSELSRLAEWLGSSPRMRGAQVQGRVPVQGQGIIPAYAGSTPWCRKSGRQTRDHPRVCGEHTSAEVEGFARTGSSPRMRGALGRQLRIHAHGGIIPAYAGSTLKYLVRCEQTSSFSFTSQGSKPPGIIVERPSNHPFLSAEFPCAVILARFAPTFLRRPCERGFFRSVRPPYQFKAIAIDWLPVRLMNLERHVLLIRRRINHDCAPLFGKRPNP